MKEIAYIQWNDSYSVGYGYIDRQHKKLVDIVNTFYEAVKHGQEADLPYKILNRLTAYAEEHFRDEETAMELAGCPAEMVKKHKAVHEELVKEIFKVAEKALTDNSTKALVETGDLLRRWLLEHILDEDMQYAPWVSKLKGPLVK